MTLSCVQSSVRPTLMSARHPNPSIEEGEGTTPGKRSVVFLILGVSLVRSVQEVALAMANEGAGGGRRPRAEGATEGAAEGAFRKFCVWTHPYRLRRLCLGKVLIPLGAVSSYLLLCFRLQHLKRRAARDGVNITNQQIRLGLPSRALRSRSPRG